MLRKKEPRVIITFHTTAGAIEMEQICKDENLLGRIIPVPRELSAGCGLAWCAPESEKERLSSILAERNLEWEEMAHMLY